MVVTVRFISHFPQLGHNTIHHQPGFIMVGVVIVALNYMSPTQARLPGTARFGGGGGAGGGHMQQLRVQVGLWKAVGHWLVTENTSRDTGRALWECVNRGPAIQCISIGGWQLVVGSWWMACASLPYT